MSICKARVLILSYPLCRPGLEIVSQKLFRKFCLGSRIILFLSRPFSKVIPVDILYFDITAI